MFRKLFGVVHGFGLATDFEGYMSHLLTEETNGYGPTAEEARRDYRTIVQERNGFIGPY